MSRFRVLQFNMQFGQCWDDIHPDHAPVRLELTIEEIKRHDADIVMLQEVEQAQPGGKQMLPPPNYTRLRDALSGYHGWFSYPREDSRELPFGVGLAILSRTELKDCTRLDLPSPPIEFEFQGRRTTPTDRLLIGARTVIDGREIRLLNTHLLAFFMLGSSSTRNPFQRQVVAEQLDAARGPALLSGDFNVSGHAALVAQFAERGFRTVQDVQPTWRRRPYVLDHIFHNEDLRCVAHRVEPTEASDHHLLAADFEFA